MRSSSRTAWAAGVVGLETALWELLTKHGGAILVPRALGRLVRTLDDVRSPLNAELVALAAEQAEVNETATGLQHERHLGHQLPPRYTR